MDRQRLPYEMFLVIASFASVRTVSRIARTSGTMRRLLGNRIYTMDWQRQQRKGLVSRALRWALFAARDFHEREGSTVDMTVVFAVAQKAIAAGANVGFWVDMGQHPLLKGSFHHLPPTLLGIAASVGDTSLARLLLDAGADVNAGYPPIHAATAQGRVSMMRLLIDHPNIRLTNFHSGYTSLLCKAVDTNDIDVVRLVTAIARPPNFIRLRRETPLHNAVLLQNPAIVAALLGCDSVHPDTLGRVELGPSKTPFQLACCRSNLAIVELLHRDTRVHVDGYADWLSPIYCALMYNQYPAAELLLRSKRAKRAHFSAMLFFIERNMIRLACRLLSRSYVKIGPDVEILRRLAERMGHSELAAELCKYRDEKTSL